MINLNTLIKSSTFFLRTATGINDQGQIVGYGTVKSNANTHAFLLSPTSTTTTLAQPASSVQTVMPSSWPGGGQSAFTLGPLVEISTPDPLAACPHKDAWQHGTRDTEVEPWVAVNPTNPNNIVAIWIAHDFSGNVASVTFDGGTTWQNVAIPGISDCTGGTGNGADPWLAFAPNGVLYAASGANFATDISRSLDGGLTWSSPINVSGTSGGTDRPSVTADPGNSNLVYAMWNTGIFGGPATVQLPTVARPGNRTGRSTLLPLATWSGTRRSSPCRMGPWSASSRSSC
jgi:probable HAF family extracellular repeat protein